MAIEFALFGLGSEKGAALIRTGASKGKVKLVFEIDGNEYSIERSLVRKRGAIQQTEGRIIFPDGKVEDYSATELKEKVLEILNFNEPPDPKAQSVIYRYAIFTPQEEMKTILFLRPDLRVQTLRKAFRIEDYRIASENSRSLVGEIESRIRILESQSSNIPELQERIDDTTSKIVDQEKELARLNSSKNEIESILKSLNDEKESLHKEEIKLSRLEGEVGPQQSLINDKEEQSIKAKEEIERLGKKLGELQLRMVEIEVLTSPTEKTYEDIEGEIEELQKKIEYLLTTKAYISAKKSDYNTILEHGVCPTCDRAISSQEFAEKVKQKSMEELHIQHQLDDCNEAMKKAKDMIKRRREYDDARKNLKQYKEKMGEYAQEIGNLNNVIASAEKEAEKASKRLKEVRKSLERLSEVSAKLKELDGNLETANKRLEKIREDITTSSTRISSQKDDVEQLEKQMEKSKELQKRAEALKEYRIWMEDCFMRALDVIEKQALLSINQDFNINFQKWFSMLVEDPSKEARVDEEFTPIVQQDGYEQDIYYLSGGEKTSVALAYRLALNTIVQRVSTGMKSNLLILDEPTDGFSKEQLAKVREVLDEIQSPQVIIVSHEKELESFADQVFRIEKVQGESCISNL